jgi:hypothetical protein
MVAEHAQRALFEGALAATISSGVHALFVPDMMTEHIEYAKNILVGVLSVCLACVLCVSCCWCCGASSDRFAGGDDYQQSENYESL